MSCHTYLLFSRGDREGMTRLSFSQLGHIQGVEGLVFEVDFLSMTEGTLHLVTNILFLCMKQSEGVVCLESIKSVNSIPKVYQNSVYIFAVCILFVIHCILFV